MPRQDVLSAAKTANRNEFYTQYVDIEREVNAYVEYNPDVFRGKTVLLPCDDPEWSNFTKYFACNFERFGLKKLISTSYAKGAGNRQLSLFEMRECICSGGDFEICVLPGFEDTWYGSSEGREYLKCYWAKNLYWFARHTTYGFSLESRRRVGDSYVCLIPPGYDYKKVRECKEITNEREFWGLS